MSKWSTHAELQCKSLISSGRVDGWQNRVGEGVIDLAPWTSYQYWGTVGTCNLHHLPAVKKYWDWSSAVCTCVACSSHLPKAHLPWAGEDTLLRMSTWLCHLASQQCSSTKLSTDSPHRPVDLWLSPGPLRLVFNSMALGITCIHGLSIDIITI